MIRANILDRLCSEMPNATSVVVLTHNIDFLFIESLLLPRLRDIGYPRLTIFADANCAAGSFQNQRELIERLGSSYRVVPIELGGVRRFHPKAILLSNEAKAALAVGSGNVTHGGWSANQEIWTDFFYPISSSGSELAAFRDYLTTILTFVPDAERIASDAMAAFTNDENIWSKDLPEPRGLAWTPNPIPMLTQITNFVSEKIQSIKVLSPYFDSEGAALTRLAEISTGDVKVLLQPRRAGLSKSAATKLPSNIKLQSIEDIEADRKHKFIHAKSYIFQMPSGVVVAAGSANCSKAGLLADDSWSNAELMVLSSMSRQTANEMFSHFLVSETSPDLPDDDPADDWIIEQTHLRILAARRDGSNLVVHYKSAAPLTRLTVISSTDEETESDDFDEQQASFQIDGSIRSLFLKGILKDGSEVFSASTWIDDEIALQTAGHERKIRERLGDAAAHGSLSGVEFLQILELFDFHLQKPVSKGAARKSIHSPKSQLPMAFSESDIYSDEFGKPPSIFYETTPIGFSETDTLALFLSFFQTRQEGSRNFRSGPKVPDNEQEDENKQIENPVDDEQARKKLGAKILRVLKKIEIAMSRPQFILNRPAARLSADIAFIALLMTKARLDGYISNEEFRTQTLQVWKAIFFGPDGTSGIIPRHLKSLAGADEDAFASEMRSPKLSAAMAVWGILEWGDSDFAPEFRFAAASLAARFRWLSQGGTADEIRSELDRIASKLLPLSQRDELFRVWANWVRDGQALESLGNALSERDQQDLAKLCVRPMLPEGELVWQKNKGICSLATKCDRANPAGKIDLIPMNQADRLKVKVAFVAPLKEVLESDIGISSQVKQHIWF